MSKYDALRDFLLAHEGEVTVHIEDLNQIVPGGIAPSASIWAPWWNNEDATHSHCRSWAAAGYEATPDIDRGLVTFRPASAARTRPS